MAAPLLGISHDADAKTNLVRVEARIRASFRPKVRVSRCEDEPLPHAEALEVRAHLVRAKVRVRVR